MCVCVCVCVCVYVSICACDCGCLAREYVRMRTHMRCVVCARTCKASFSELPSSQLLEFRSQHHLSVRLDLVMKKQPNTAKREAIFKSDFTVNELARAPAI